jgi:hypothetical protein
MISMLHSPLRAGKISASRTLGSVAVVAAIVLAFIRADAHLIVAELLAFAVAALGLRDKAVDS